MLASLTLSVIAVLGLTALLLTHSKRIDRLESRLATQAEIQETVNGKVDSLRPKLDGLEMWTTRAAGLAESASRASDIALNAAGSVSREIDRRSKP
jgi:hypothetical protein